MSTRRRTWWPVWLGAFFLAVLAALLFLRAKAPPEAARLLPESDAILYVNLRPFRALAASSTSASRSLRSARSHDFQSFIDKTGIMPERDLDSIAVALHRMPDASGPNGSVAYSEVFTGRFDASRLRQYLAGLARSTSSYGDRDIYNIPVEGRTLRVAILAFDTVAASNAPTEEQIHSILDRSRAAALWRPGSSLLAARFGEVPLLSQAWGIGRIGLPFSDRGMLSVMGFALPVPVDTQLIASLRYGGSVHLRIEEIAPDALAAQHTAESVKNILSVLRGVASAQNPRDERDRAMRTLLSGAQVTQHEERATLTAQASVEAVRMLTTQDVPGTGDGVPLPVAPTLSK